MPCTILYHNKWQLANDPKYVGFGFHQVLYAFLNWSMELLLLVSSTDKWTLFLLQTSKSWSGNTTSFLTVRIFCQCSTWRLHPWVCCFKSFRFVVASCHLLQCCLSRVVWTHGFFQLRKLYLNYKIICAIGFSKSIVHDRIL